LGSNNKRNCHLISNNLNEKTVHKYAV